MEQEVPRRQPLELIKQGSLWVVEDYRKGSRRGETRHPCIVRWDSPRSVGALYWNPLFETLEVRRDELVGGWSVVPEAGTCAMTVAPSREDAADPADRFDSVGAFHRALANAV